MARRIIDSHAHVGDIFHDKRNVTFQTNITKGDYDDPFIACEKSGYAHPLIPQNQEELNQLIHAGQYRVWEWTLENVTAELDKHPEVEGVVMLPIWPNQTFEEYLAASRLEPRILPFTTPVLSMDTPAMVEKLRRDIQLGAKGLKIHPTIQNIALDDEKIQAAVQVFGEADLPIVTHAGANPYYTDDSPWSRETNPANSDIPKIVEFCHQWPDYKIVAAHCCTMVEIFAPMVADLDNVYVDTSMCSAAMMRKGVEILGADRILFGTDVPFGSFHYSIKELDKAFAHDPETLDKVAYSNMMNLMNMPTT